MHHVQKSIILNLARTSPLRFTELQPPHIPNNAFSYHLKKLIDGNYIELGRGGYIATRKALKLVVFGASDNQRQPTPSLLTMVYVENLEGEILLINRNQKPFQGWYSLPSGLIHQGETPEKAARREIYEKTGLAAGGPLQAAGVLDVRYVEEATQDIFVHTISFVYQYQFSGDKKLLEGKVNRYGPLSWSKLGRSNILAEVIAAKDLVDKHSFGHQSITFFEPPQLPAVVAVAEHTDELPLKSLAVLPTSVAS